jgi:chloramphenicol-sensitive protein RarD
VAPVERGHLVGAAYAVAAYGAWGLAPVYWRAVRSVPPLEMVAHRVLWALPVMIALVAWRRRLAEVWRAIRAPGHRGLLLLTATLVSVNWLVFIWAIGADRILEASLGYFVNPLLNVLLGVVFLGERLRPGQTAAVLLATLGVAWLTVSLGALPWVALLLAGTFGAYGLLRKRAGVDALVGLAVETAFLAPVGAAYVALALARGESAVLRGGPGFAALVVASGLVTALPLLWFANAARRLRYATLGFFQYLAPTGQFLLAVVAYREPFTSAHAVAFACIWAAIALYVVETARASRRPLPSPDVAVLAPDP